VHVMRPAPFWPDRARQLAHSLASGAEAPLSFFVDDINAFSVCIGVVDGNN